MRTFSLLLFLLVAAGASAQNQVSILVDAAGRIGPYKPIYGYFGYDEPNYTYTRNGRKLVGELAALSATPVYIRTHFLLATGDGAARLKWGSTNAYTEDASGKAVYDWTIVDRIFDTYREAGAKPFVEVGFMPEALSSKPEPYAGIWIPGAKNEQYSVGWSYPPKDYAKWGELVYQWVRHAAEKYGADEVASWYWEIWNEPDIGYWHGTPRDYDRLYDYAADGVKRALPRARVGGPATTGGGSNFLRQFLEHCSIGANSATGKTGAPLDFITFHAKGSPKEVDGRVEMGIASNARNVLGGFQVVAAFPQFRDLPIVLSESDPEGCAACSARVYPRNAYRNGPLYASYTAVMLKSIFELADRERANIEGMLTWAFQFEGQPYFDGFRTLATNGIDKPALNLFRMAGLMRGERVKVESSGRVPLDRILADGVRGEADVDALAVSGERTISVLAWNYLDDDLTGADAARRAARVALRVAGVARLAGAAGRVLVRQYRIDETHSNAWTLWKEMGSPRDPAPPQYAALEAAGQLQELDSPRWIPLDGGEVDLEIVLPLAAVSLLQISW
ncbi:MAG: GH39 family glycosyl hydrolase [Bryobacteraceae bacterium]